MSVKYINTRIDEDGDMVITQSYDDTLPDSVIYLNLDEVNIFINKLKNTKNAQLRYLGKIK